MTFARWITGLLLLTSASVSLANEPSLFENQYTAKLYGFTITATSRLSATANGNGHYEFLFDADALLGNITETSEFSWGAKDKQVTPLRYTYVRTGMGKNSNYELQFDWGKHTVTNLQNHNSISMDGVQKLQDNLSYQVQLRQDLIAGKNNFTYEITNGKKIRSYRFEIAGEEMLDTALGKVNTVKVRRVQTNDKREIYAWFAKDFQYLMVRLQQEENDSTYTINITKASLNGKAIEHF